jgi:hypothetical protein
MERENTGTKYMAANCEGSQSPPRAIEQRKKTKKKGQSTVSIRARYWTLS